MPPWDVSWSPLLVPHSIPGVDITQTSRKMWRVTKRNGQFHRLRSIAKDSDLPHALLLNDNATSFCHHFVSPLYSLPRQFPQVIVPSQPSVRTQTDKPLGRRCLRSVWCPPARGESELDTILLLHFWVWEGGGGLEPGWCSGRCTPLGGVFSAGVLLRGREGKAEPVADSALTCVPQVRAVCD